MRARYILIGAGIGLATGVATGGLISHLVDNKRAKDVTTTTEDDFVEDLMDEFRPASQSFEEYNSDRKHYLERDS